MITYVFFWIMKFSYLNYRFTYDFICIFINLFIIKFNAVAANEVFTILMGDNVEPRREFIQKHALEVLNLDI